MSDLSFFHLTEQYPDEASAVAYFEARRWPSGAYCPICSSRHVYNCNARRRLPLYKCQGCNKQFTVTSGTVMNNTRIPLRAWLFAFHMIGGGKKGIPARQIARHLGITIKSAWHLSHRIRATMADNRQFFSGGIVESDETYIGGKRRGHGRGYRGNKIAVQTIVERKHRTTLPGARKSSASECTNECPGRVQTIALRPEDGKVDGRTVGANLRKHVDPKTTRLMTDESPIYSKLGKSFKSHETVNHAQKEYVRTDEETGRLISTNAAEGFFANLKRQITGTHHSTSKKHLPRYLEEHDYKYNTRGQADTERTEAAIDKIGETKPVTLYKSTSGQGESLIETKKDEKRKHGTKRGSSKHVRTGKKKESAPVVPPPIPGQAAGPTGPEGYGGAQ